jgi:hypothetical protein
MTREPFLRFHTIFWYRFVRPPYRRLLFFGALLEIVSHIIGITKGITLGFIVIQRDAIYKREVIDLFHLLYII